MRVTCDSCPALGGLAGAQDLESEGKTGTSLPNDPLVFATARALALVEFSYDEVIMAIRLIERGESGEARQVL